MLIAALMVMKSISGAMICSRPGRTSNIVALENTFTASTGDQNLSSKEIPAKVNALHVDEVDKRLGVTP